VKNRPLALVPRGSPPPAPADAPLLALEDVAGYTRSTLPALRQRILAGTDELAVVLRENLVTLGPRRRYIRREPFMLWLTAKACPSAPGSERETRQPVTSAVANS